MVPVHDLGVIGENRLHSYFTENYCDEPCGSNIDRLEFRLCHKIFQVNS